MSNLLWANEGTCYEQIKKQTEERYLTNQWNDGNHWPACNSRTPYTPTFALTDKWASGISRLSGAAKLQSAPGDNPRYTPDSRYYTIAYRPLQVTELYSNWLFKYYLLCMTYHCFFISFIVSISGSFFKEIFYYCTIWVAFTRL